MIEAGFLSASNPAFPVVEDATLKKYTGITSDEHDDLQALPAGPSLFLTLLRRKHITEKGPFSIHELYSECLELNPHAFGSANFAKTIKAHVIAMVSTGGFSAEAYKYASEVSNATNLQFLFVDGRALKNYLSKGPQYLHQFVMENAARVMLQKRGQPLEP